ncbi:hypothetical protein [Methanosarcina sp.]|uniref:hypothetical protein n=1 Tax=Methanosarcina sp. TaxID=2213 RepID=UPI002988B2DA|nr:hypothetical protein [Methanosarcina sp.]MDW5549529.1 hypothetical protein [Methanosarcina sp.]MDW5553563.1 hypothetical protein [Methanosarcina sp.]MDW5558633.1 hypothetical protein [Methanosarcina sp.]
MVIQKPYNGNTMINLFKSSLKKSLNVTLVVQSEAKSDLKARIEVLKQEVYKVSKSKSKENKIKKIGPLRLKLRSPTV